MTAMSKLFVIIPRVYIDAAVKKVIGVMDGIAQVSLIPGPNQLGHMAILNCITEFDRRQTFVIQVCFSRLDEDVCTDNTRDCHARAVCDKTEGSYRCCCREGYRGNRRNCTGKVDSWSKSARI